MTDLSQGSFEAFAKEGHLNGMGFLQRAKKVGRKFENPVPTQLGGFRLIVKLLPLYYANREQKTPAEPVGPFRTDVSAYDAAPASGLRVTWFGHSASLLEIDGARVLIDPVWDERAAPVQWFGPKRFFPPTLPLEQLPRIDAVLISHDHYDHLGKGTIQRLARLMPGVRWVTSKGVSASLRKFGVAATSITELDWTESVAIGELTVTSAPSRHFSGRGMTNRNETLWGSFVLKGPKHTVYYGADSGWWEGFEEIGKAYGPFDLTLLEIGAYHPLWGDIHLGPDNAVKAFEALGGEGLLMPIHWGLFDLALHGWRQPMTRLLELVAELGTTIWSPEPGRPTEVVAGTTVLADWWRG